MRPFFRDPRRVAGIGALLVLVVATLRGFPQREAKADPPDLGPAGWGTLDARVVSPDLARRALIRYALLCEPANAGVVASGVLIGYANGGLLGNAEATVVSCALGAPPPATCADLRACTGEKPGEPPPTEPACMGVFVARSISVGAPTPGGQKTLRATESCLSQGGRCFERGGSALCATEACTPGETYACLPGGISLCMEGLRIQSPCPMGTACGASPGSGVLGCIGTGGPCSDDSSRCDGTKRVACTRDGFGKGSEAVVDCQSFGLGCAASGPAPSGVAACSLDASSQCDTQSTAWSCEAGLVRSCVAGRFYNYACADLGMAGTCAQGPSGPFCKP